MKIFITGATGYVGQRLALHFANLGFTVHALVRSGQKSHLLQHPGITLFNGHINQPAALEKAAQGCEVCIHGAAYSALYTRNNQLYSQINITGTQQVFEAARNAGIKKFIHISSAGVFGPSGSSPVNEDTARSLPYFNEYERTKDIADKWVLSQNSSAMPVLTLNLTRVYGPGQLSEANAGTRLIEKVMEGWRMVPGNGVHVGNYVFIDDVVVACQNAIKNGRGGHRYIIGGENLSFNEYFDKVKAATGATQTMVKLPVGIIMAYAHLLQLLAYFGLTPLITPQWAKRYLYNWVIDTSKAQKELGYKPTPFSAGVEKTVKWLKNRQTMDEPVKQFNIEVE